MRRARALVCAILGGLILIATAATAHAAYPPTGTPGTPVVTQNGEETIVFSSLDPSTPYHVVVHSTPLDLGMMMSDNSGSLAVTFSTAGLDVGSHTVAATSPTGDVVTATFTVMAAPTSGASSSGSSGPASAATASPSAATGLAFTGARVEGLIGVALVLVIVGLVAVRIGRRGRT